MNKKTKKVLSLALAAVLLVCTTVAATVAYLQDSTEVVENTFTVGNVTIDLDEAPVDLYGDVLENTDRRKANEYKLIPGHEYTKDPTVHILPESEASYVFMEVIIKGYDVACDVYGADFLPQNVVKGWDPAVWVSTKDVKVSADGKEARYVFYYNEEVADTLGATEKVSLEPLFTHIFMEDGFDYDDVNALKSVVIDVYAHAIQADGFDITNADDIATMRTALGID